MVEIMVSLYVLSSYVLYIVLVRIIHKINPKTAVLTREDVHTLIAGWLISPISVFVMLLLLICQLNWFDCFLDMIANKVFGGRIEK